MGKRSAFLRVERDYYPTPAEAVAPLIPHLTFGDMFVEPCAGNGALVDHLEAEGLSCQWAADIAPQRADVEKRDALSDLSMFVQDCEWIITNPPWSRNVLHPMIKHFSSYRPAWLLFDADWIHTRQAVPLLPRLRKIVAVGRVKWIPGSRHSGKDNCAWHLFDRSSDRPPEFYGRMG